MTRIVSANVCLHGKWLPCEYQMTAGLVSIQSLGDVECSDLTANLGAPSLQSAAEKVFSTIPDTRKLVVLVPQQTPDRSKWPWRQVLKSALVASTEEVPG